MPTAAATVTRAGLQDDGGTANGGVDTSAVADVHDHRHAGQRRAELHQGRGPDASLEDAGAADASPAWATGIRAGPANEAGQTLNFLVTNNNNRRCSACQPAVAADGTLTYTPARECQRVGDRHRAAARTTAARPTAAIDTSAAQTFTITVTPVNDAPSFTKGADQTVARRRRRRRRCPAGRPRSIPAGPPNESGQTVCNFIVSNDNHAAVQRRSPTSPPRAR